MRRCAALILFSSGLLLACSRQPAPSAVAYTCTPPHSLSVEYEGSAGKEGRAQVILDGRSFTMENVRSASGARYLASPGRSPDATLVWWNKGRDGTLFEGRVSDPDAAGQVIATCTQAP